MSSKTVFDVLRIAHARAEAEYTELSEGWRASDNKALSTSTIAGVFLAAAFAVAASERMPSTPLASLVIVLLALFLVSAVVLSILAMRVRKLPTPLPADKVATMVKDIMRVCADEHASSVDDRLSRLFADMIDARMPVNNRIREMIDDKNIYVVLSQYCLVGASIFVLALIVVVVC